MIGTPCVCPRKGPDDDEEGEDDEEGDGVKVIEMRVSTGSLEGG